MKRVLAAAILAASLLAACDRKPEPPAAPAASAPAVPRVERAGPVTWDAQARVFKLAGQPLRTLRLWTFQGSTDGFTGVRSLLQPEVDGMLVTIADPTIRSPRGLAIPGDQGNLVLVRMTRVGAGELWDGALHYTTPEHGEASGFLGKPISGDNPQVGETVTLVYDMTRQKKGGEDWVSSQIDQIRLDIEDKPGGKFLIHQIAIVQNPDPAAFAALAPPAPAAPKAPAAPAATAASR